MEERKLKDRRRYKRLPINLHLEVNEIFKQDYVIIKDINTSAFVFDISKSGIGFISEAELPIDYYFTALINLGRGDFFRCVIRIVRASHMSKNRWVYGAEFVGLAPFLADKVDKYERYLNNIADI
ncbi:MAG: PilZ domain-containing protein [Clostridiales bacterium]|jgi:hypothetical protein|nr:PilZ domain-containing protein [Clostridiales bacterium]